jgi:hypothetical protein
MGVRVLMAVAAGKHQTNGIMDVKGFKIHGS